MFLIIILMLVGFAVLAFYKRPINTQAGWAPPPHVLFGQQPQRPVAPEVPAASPADGPAQRLATFAPPPPASGAPSTFAPPPTPGSIKIDQPPPVDLNDLFNRPNA